MRRSVLAVSAAASLALAMSVTLAPGVGAAPAPDSATRVGAAPSPDKVTLPTRARGLAGKGGGGSPISYHRGGAVMTAGVPTAYYVWYGDWSTTGGQSILTDFASNLSPAQSPSPYWKINTSYYDAAKRYVSPYAAYGGAVTATDWFGTDLTDAQILTIISDEITTGRLPSDENGVYFLLSAKGVTATSGFLTKYCGWHSYTTIGSATIKYSFVGNADGPNLSSCAWQTASSPNGNPGVDAMVSVVAHEFEEAVTDPQLNAWFDGRGYENADKCAWTFGSTYPVSGALANVKLGSRDYLIQRNWSARTQACGMS